MISVLVGTIGASFVPTAQISFIPFACGDLSHKRHCAVVFSFQLDFNKSRLFALCRLS